MNRQINTPLMNNQVKIQVNKQLKIRQYKDIKYIMLDEKTLELITEGKVRYNIKKVMQTPKAYPIFYLQKASNRTLLVKRNSDASGPMYISLPNRSRYTDKNYYRKFKKLKFRNPRNLNFIMITLTLDQKKFTLEAAYRNIKRYLTSFLNRMQNYFQKKISKSLQYFYVIDVHENGYPHVHLLVSIGFIKKKLLLKWWVDDENKPLCKKQGINIRSFKTNPEPAIKYMVNKLLKVADTVFAIDIAARVKGSNAIETVYDPMKYENVAVFNIPYYELTKFDKAEILNIMSQVGDDKVMTVIAYREAASYIWYYGIRLYAFSERFFIDLEPKPKESNYERCLNWSIQLHRWDYSMNTSQYLKRIIEFGFLNSPIFADDIKYYLLERNIDRLKAKMNNNTS